MLYQLTDVATGAIYAVNATSEDEAKRRVSEYPQLHFVESPRGITPSTTMTTRSLQIMPPATEEMGQQMFRQSTLLGEKSSRVAAYADDRLDRLRPDRSYQAGLLAPDTAEKLRGMTEKEKFEWANEWLIDRFGHLVDDESELKLDPGKFGTFATQAKLRQAMGADADIFIDALDPGRKLRGRVEDAYERGRDVRTGERDTEEFREIAGGGAAIRPLG